MILSACDTSPGKLTRGDELIGLTRAFIYAGTPSVISTLWRVEDRASYELMRVFYRGICAWDRAGGTRSARHSSLPYGSTRIRTTGPPTSSWAKRVRAALREMV